MGEEARLEGLLLSSNYFIWRKDMRVSCPAGSTAPFAKSTTLSVPNGINKFPNAGLSSSFQLCQ